MPTIEQRLKSLTSNLEAAIKAESPNAPHLMLLHAVKELADIVEQMLPAPPPEEVGGQR